MTVPVHKVDGSGDYRVERIPEGLHGQSYVMLCTDGIEGSVMRGAGGVNNVIAGVAFIEVCPKFSSSDIWLAVI